MGVENVAPGRGGSLSEMQGFPERGAVWRVRVHGLLAACIDSRANMAPGLGLMGIQRISRVTTEFVMADMEYMRLVGLMVDFERKGSTRITAEEIHAVRDAKGKRDLLEAQMFALWEEESSGVGDARWVQKPEDPHKG